MHNKKKQKNSSSEYHGVHKCKRVNKFRVSFMKDGVKYYFGYSYDDEIEAANVYDVEVQKVYGSFARLNFEKNRIVQTET